MKKTLSVFAIILLASCRFGSNSLCIQGEREFMKGNSDKAIELFSNAIKLDPENIIAYNARCQVYYKMHDLKNAIADEEKIIAINPKIVMIYLNLARFKFESADTTGAIMCANRAIAIYPNFWSAYVARSSLKYSLKDYQGAIDDATKSILVRPFDTMKLDSIEYSYATRAKAEHKLNDNVRAFKDIDTALTLSPHNPIILYSLGRIYFDLGKYDDASLYLEKSYKQNRSDGHCSLLLGVTDIKNGYNAIGCAEMKRALKNGIKEAADSITKYCK